MLWLDRIGDCYTLGNKTPGGSYGIRNIGMDSNAEPVGEVRKTKQQVQTDRHMGCNSRWLSSIDGPSSSFPKGGGERVHRQRASLP